MLIKQKKLFWQIFLLQLAILVVAILAVGWYSARTFDQFYIGETGRDLENRAALIESRIGELLAAGDHLPLRMFVVSSGRASGTRITVIEPDGRVIADTSEDPEQMDNHRQRPEIDTAFSGSTGHSLRFSNTLGQRMLYTAIPLYQLAGSQGPVVGVLRLSVPVTAIDSALNDIRLKLGGGALLAIVGAFVLTFLVSRSISRPLEDMTRRAEQYARGDFSRRMPLSGKINASREIAALTSAMDQMAVQLDDKITTIVRQRNQLEAVFSSMVEAVIAVDREERIISINEAAARMFGVSRTGTQGRLLQEVIRNLALAGQLERILTTGIAFEDEIVLESGRNGGVYLQTHAVSLQGADARAAGALIVLNDVTRLRRLESMRSDFVANVSHELRTPITSIRGYVETLLDGALDDRQDAEKFLEIVLDQSEQLEEIIDDLLALSRIERDAKDSQIDFEPLPLRQVLEEALERCRPKAEERGIGLRLSCADGLVLNMNQNLMEQAVVNLLLNGITYSEPGTEVVVEVDEERGDNGSIIRVSVIDQGIGIAEQHLPRLFERFYRSDKARSRTQGGTGLGLAIVKHIVQAHGGRIEVRSVVGKGSEFRIIFENQAHPPSAPAG